MVSRLVFWMDEFFFFFFRGSLNDPTVGGIQQCKSLVKFEGFPLSSALFGLVI